MPQHICLVLIVALSILMMLVHPRGIREVYWISAGAALLLFFRLIPIRLAAHAIEEGLDVYLFLIGMMLLSALADAYGVFDWFSSIAIRHANGSSARLFTLIYALGTLVTIFLSNDATAVVLTPAILIAVRKAKVQPLPHFFACALVANAASFVLPISNPANLVVFHHGMPPLSHWLLQFGFPSLLSIATTYLVLRFLFRKDLAGRIEQQDEPAPLNSEGRLVLAGIALTIAILLSASALNRDLGLPTCLAAFLITAVVSIESQTNPIRLFKEVSWSTLVLVAGLFILVDAAESIGALSSTQAALRLVQTLTPAFGTFVTAFAIGISNNLVNNLPLGLLAGATVQAAHLHGLLVSAVLIGVDLGPNLSITGSLATILWLLALRKENLNVSFLDFLKVGAIAMPIALAAAIAGSLLIGI